MTDACELRKVFFFLKKKNEFMCCGLSWNDFLKLFYNYAVGCHFFMLSLMTLHGIAVSIDFEQGKIV